MHNHEKRLQPQRHPPANPKSNDSVSRASALLQGILLVVCVYLQRVIVLLLTVVVAGGTQDNVVLERSSIHDEVRSNKHVDRPIAEDTNCMLLQGKKEPF